MRFDRRFAGTLVVARAYAGPREEMFGRREPAHVDPDFGDDDMSAEVLDARHRRYDLDCGAKGAKVRLHLRVDGGHGDIKSVDRIEMKSKQKAMVIACPAAKGLAQFLRSCLHPPIGKARQFGGNGL